MSNSTGSTLLGKTVWIKSNASMKGLVIHQNMTGTILLGTGSLNFGSDGVRMGSGRLIGGTNNLSGSGSFTMTGGIVRLGATDLYLSGSLVISKGVGASYTEFVSTGSIVFNSRIADQTFTVGSTGSNTNFNNLTINNTAGTTIDDINVDASVLALSGSLTITQGNLNLETSDVPLLVENGITLANNAQATLTMGSGDLTMSGHLVMGAAASADFTADNTVTLNGIDQNFDINNSPFRNLTIASSSGTHLTSDQSVTGTIQINTGSTLSLDTYTIYATGATIINYGTLSEGTGKIKHSASNILITDSSYSEDNALTPGYVYFTVTDSDENIDGTAQDTMAITVTVSSGDSESVTLTETTKTSGIFRGSILATSSTNYVASNGALEATAASTTVSFTYTDAQDTSDTGSDTATMTITTSSASSASTTTGAGGGRRGGGGPTAPSAAQSASSSQNAVGALPEVRGYLSVSIDGQQVVFRDVPVVEWFAQYVLSLVDAGVISGYRDAQGELTGEFKPGNSVTYAEIAKMAVEAAGLMPRVGATPNNRSARGQWSAGYIAALEERGVSAFAASGLDVNAPAPRGAVLQIILETFGQTIASPQGGMYSDVSAETTFAGAVETATSNGIVSGDDGKNTFRPAAPINRAETAKIVRNAMMKF
ncbi:MAG: S-layer homology domain-containing protein [Candidatus Peregrinibacteria bacterium]